MYFLWVIGLLGLFVTYMIAGLPDAETTAEKDLKSVAELMYFYHDAAREVCISDPAYCSGNQAISNGRVLAEMPPSIASGEIYQSNYFRSFSNSAGVTITINDYINRRMSVTDLSASFDTMINAFTNQLTYAVRNGAPFGVYDYGSQRLVDISSAVGGSNMVIPVARTIDGVTIRNNVPMIASP